MNTTDTPRAILEPPYRPSYLACLCAGVSRFQGDAYDDGVSMGTRLVEQRSRMEDVDQFPPKLLILLVSPPYCPPDRSSQLLTGIKTILSKHGQDQIPMIGASMNGVIFDHDVHRRGALLVCLASRSLTAQIHVADISPSNTERSFRDLLSQLGLTDEQGEAVGNTTPLSRCSLFCFLPELRKLTAPGAQRATDLYERLVRATFGRIPIIGTASTGADSHPGLQFKDWGQYSDAMVVAKIWSGHPFASSIADGFQPSLGNVRIAGVTDDGFSISRFDLADGRRSAVEVMAELWADGRPAVLRAPSQKGGIALDRGSANDDGSLSVPYPAAAGADVDIGIWDADATRKDIHAATVESIKRVYVRNPNACVLFWPSNRDPCGQRDEALTGHVRALAGALRVPCFGALVDGQIGFASRGSLVCGENAFGQVVLGDELRPRYVAERGFEVLAAQAPELLAAATLRDVIDSGLSLIQRLGFSGAMVSLLCSHREDDYIVAFGAVGKRYKRIQGNTIREASSDDILALVARGDTPSPVFVADAASEPHNDAEAVRESGIISQFAMSLQSVVSGEVRGTLQVDLGDARHTTQPEPQVVQLLTAARNELAATIDRFMGRRYLEAVRNLDDACLAALAAEGEEEALQIFAERTAHDLDVKGVHMRLQRDGHALLLVAGIGRYFDAARKERPSVDTSSASASCQAFLDGKTVICNMPSADPDHRRFRRRCGSDLLGVAADWMPSYAHVPIVDDNQNVLGVVCIVGQTEWFFHKGMRQILDHVGRRAGFVVAAVRRKRSQGEADRRLQFILNATPELASMADFSEPSRLYSKLIARLKRAFNADVASLMLWDDERGALVLRAQEGWRDPDWVGAALYCEGMEGWTWYMARERTPRYIDDLLVHKRQQYGDDSLSRYATHMYGALPNDQTVEAIGLPLRAGERLLGVVALLKVRPPRQRGTWHPGFSVVDDGLLRQVTAEVSALVAMVESHTHHVWESREEQRKDRVMKALLSRSEDEKAVDCICAAMIDAYHARISHVFQTLGTEGALCWSSGYQRNPTNREPTATGEIQADDLVREAHASGRVTVHRHASESDQGITSTAQRAAFLVDRACIPLCVEGNTVGVLDVRWTVSPKRGVDRRFRHSSVHLRELGIRLAVLLQREKLELARVNADRRARLQERVTEAMATMLFQAVHRIGNNLRSLSALSGDIRDAHARTDQDRLLKELDQIIDNNSVFISRLVASMGSGREPPKPVPVQTVVRERLASMRKPSNVRVIESVAEDLVCSCNRQQIGQAIDNIIENALNYMREKGGSLTVLGGELGDAGLAWIDFVDTGPGMSAEKIRSALEGFVKTSTGMGVGLLIARTLCQLNEGKLDINSAKGTGTTVRITLPIAEGDR